MRNTVVLFLATVLWQSVWAQPYEVRKSYTDEAGWVGMIEGDMPLVISVPHGGTLNLDNIPDRSCEGAITVTDSYTRELAMEIADMMQRYHGRRPYIVFCNLIRKDIDQNREIEAATCGNALMDGPWKTFHNFIDTALAMATHQFGGSVYIDLHGHGHPAQRLELGYLLKESELKDLADGKADVNKLAVKSSLNNFISSNSSHQNLQELLTGDAAFGTLMANEGIPSVPSKQDPYPKEGEKYFNGGFNTREYTSAQYPNVIGWQIETNMKGVRDKAGRPVFAKAFCKVIVQFIQQQTSFKFPANISIQ